MPHTPLPVFLLEDYFARWEFKARHHLTASDAESMSIGELLGFEADGGDHAGRQLSDLSLGYVPTRGTAELRRAVSATYTSISPDQVMSFAGAEEAVYWAMQALVGPGDHAVVTLPNYQAMESVTIATGADVSGLPLWTGTGDNLRWTLDLSRFRQTLRPNTRMVAVNFPNNPTGFVPDPDTWAAFLALCDERGITVFSDEVYRGLELDTSRSLPQAADLSDKAVSLNVTSKAYGLPGLRVGWVATHDKSLLRRLERGKHYTSICNAGPSEYLAALALRHSERLLSRSRQIVAENIETFRAFFDDYPGLFQWQPPDGGCVSFPRYLGEAGVETFCHRLVEDRGVLLLPASIYRSALGTVPDDHFRVGIGRRHPEPALHELRSFIEEGGCS